MSDFPKYQYSLFVGTKGQIVVRTDDPEEFKSLVQKVDYTYGATTEAPPPAAGLCPIHGVAYDKSGIGKTGKPWAGHRLPDNSMCWRK